MADRDSARSGVSSVNLAPPFLLSPRLREFVSSSTLLSSFFPLSSRLIQATWVASMHRVRTFVSSLGRCAGNIAGMVVWRWVVTTRHSLAFA